MDCFFCKNPAKILFGELDLDGHGIYECRECDWSFVTVGCSQCNDINCPLEPCYACKALICADATCRRVCTCGRGHFVCIEHICRFDLCEEISCMHTYDARCRIHTKDDKENRFSQ